MQEINSNSYGTTAEPGSAGTVLIEAGDHKGNDLENTTNTEATSAFVEIPMAGEDTGKREIQITGFQTPVEKAMMPSDHMKGNTLQEKEVTFEGSDLRSAEMVIQAGGIKLLIYRGIQEATLRTVMKVVMDHA
ncbi:MAG: hypothetical protein IJV16_08305 [Lachnospiraceae bacterium]|nr:hypothetical protein [Lachnospiraceae bacterium]